ncbi:unnamed protein product [Lampetra fluviatilis]
MIVSRKQRAFPTSDAQVCPIIRSDRNAPACRELLRTILNARIYQLVKTVSGPIDVGASRPGSGARAAGARVLRRGQGSAWLGLMETLSVGEIGLRADSISTIGTRQPAPETSSTAALIKGRAVSPEPGHAAFTPRSIPAHRRRSPSTHPASSHVRRRGSRDN